MEGSARPTSGPVSDTLNEQVYQPVPHPQPYYSEGYPQPQPQLSPPLDARGSPGTHPSPNSQATYHDDKSPPLQSAPFGPQTPPFQPQTFQPYSPPYQPPSPNPPYQPGYAPSGSPNPPYQPAYPPSASPNRVTSPASGAPEVIQGFGFYQPQPGQGHRSLSPTLSQGSTAYGSAGRDSIPPNADGKEVYAVYQQPLQQQQQQQQHPEQAEKPRRRVCGLPILLFWIVVGVILLVLLGAGLGAGLGLGLKKKSNPAAAPATNTTKPFTGNPKLSIGGAIDPKYYSTKGAWNGSGIAFAGESFSGGERGLATVYFQHHTGDIRWMRLNSDYNWVGGTKAETVASDAKNSTPLSTVAYVMNGTNTYHLFYISKDGYVIQKSNSNATNFWQDGYVNQLKLKAFDDDSVGLQACWYGNFYGDSDYSKFPTVNGDKNTLAYSSQFGMHLWFPSDATTMEQYGYYEGQKTWISQRKWPGINGHAGVGCYSWGPGTVSYAMMVNLQNTIEFWWKDTNSSLPSTESHPIQSWQNATGAAINNVWPSTSLGYTTFFYAQSDDGFVRGYNISYEAESTTIVQDNTTIVGDASGPVAAIGGSHLTVSAIPNQKGAGANLWVFYQVNGDDITVFQRGLTEGQWGRGPMPIPDL
ncbi:hypothetical protein EJ06DRAFT_528740 [Trichodelitschia bisporula]|uniref:Fucose-specific lectin n=1 Tax=Trichodelitschia bisporula TaxID=703511 RepID=A0A6G1I3U0_9PEZI|nr:hypothetical protein EJ06DRAFT_528740 [Trichodelitschia bisporula]